MSAGRHYCAFCLVFASDRRKMSAAALIEHNSRTITAQQHALLMCAHVHLKIPCYESVCHCLVAVFLCLLRSNERTRTFFVFHFSREQNNVRWFERSRYKKKHQVSNGILTRSKVFLYVRMRTTTAVGAMPLSCGNVLYWSGGAHFSPVRCQNKYG